MIFPKANQKTVQVSPGVLRKHLAAGGRLMAVEVHFEQGAVGAIHQHPNEQVTYVLSGRFEFQENDKKTVIGKGDSVYVESNVPHGVVALETGVLLDVFTPQREDFLA